MTVRWTFTDVHHSGPPPYTYQFDINPNEGGSPGLEKPVTTSQSTGPGGPTIVQEGGLSQITIGFKGVILTQTHYEALEDWFMRRVLLELDDDLGRKFRGVFTKWAPARERRTFNPWFHTYEADFLVMAYKSASNKLIYGRFN